MSLFATNDELFAKLRAGNPGFDVIVPSNEFVTRLRLARLIQPLDLAKIPNRKNLLPAFQNPPFDPGRRWSMPYTWLVLGLGYRKSKIDGVPDSWKWVMDCDRYAGRIGLFSEADDLIELGAKYLGHSVRDIPVPVIDQVAEMYIRQKKYVKIFHHDEGEDAVADRRYRHRHGIQRRHRPGDGRGPRPRFRGAARGFSCSIPIACASRPARPGRTTPTASSTSSSIAKAGAEIYETIRYPTPNAAALALMPADYRDNQAIFPPPRPDGQVRIRRVRRHGPRPSVRRNRHPDLRGVRGLQIEP